MYEKYCSNIAFFNDKKVRIGCQFVLINLLGKKVRCGYNEDASLLDWHHPSPGQKYKHDNGKRLSVAEMISRGLSKDLMRQKQINALGYVENTMQKLR